MWLPSDDLRFTLVKSYHRMQNTPKTLSWSKKKNKQKPYT